MSTGCAQKRLRSRHLSAQAGDVRLAHALCVGRLGEVDVGKDVNLTHPR